MDSVAQIPWRPASRPHPQPAPEPPDDATDIPIEERRSSALTRLLAALALLGLAAGLAFLGHAAYWAMADSYVAPMSVSPDSELVLANKARLIQLEGERARARTQTEALDSDLAQLDIERIRLAELRERAARAVPWTESITSLEASAGTATSSALEKARSVLVGLIARQSKILEEARGNLQLGMIPRAEYEKEEQALSQLNLALLENERNRAQSELLRKKTLLGQRALGGERGAAAMPELLANEGLMVRLELELLHLEGQKRIKLSEREALSQTIIRLDDLASKLKTRPLFQAVEKSLDLAFAPYTQLEGIRSGAKVFSCVLGIFACQEVGSVAEIVPGEVVLPDPWGKQARGQYLVLNLLDRGAARSTILRIRSSVSLSKQVEGGPAPGRAETSSW